MDFRKVTSTSIQYFLYMYSWQFDLLCGFEKIGFLQFKTTNIDILLRISKLK